MFRFPADFFYFTINWFLKTGKFDDLVIKLVLVFGKKTNGGSHLSAKVAYQLKVFRRL